MPDPFRPPRLTLDQARLARALAHRRAPVAVAGFAVSFGAAPSVVEDPVVLALALSGAPARASVPRRLLRDVMAALDPAAVDAAGEAACLLLELALEPALCAVEADGLAVRLWPDPAADWPDGLAAGLSCRDAGGRHALRLDLSPAAARLLATGLARVPDEPRPLPALAVALRVRAMATDLSLDTVRALRQGDVILAATPGQDGSQVLIVAGERACWRADRHDGTLTLATRRLDARRAGLGDWMMTDDESGRPALADDAAMPLGAMPVRLVFELGRVEVTLAELERIGPGHVFELASRPEEQSVDILANGQRVGCGRIVAVGEGLGVQVAWIGKDG